MSLNVLKDARKVYAGLNADDIRASALKDLSIGLMATSEAGFLRLVEFLAPPSLDPESRARVLECLHPVNGELRNDGSLEENFDFVLCEAGLALPPHGHSLDPASPSGTIREIAAAHHGIELALGRTLPHFRETVARRIAQRVARENALFALFTALPNVLPSFIELPWVVGEFATDTAFLTMNQIRMALMMAALNDRPVGYGEQKMQLAAIAGGAFGWRALARELVGKIPLGGGLIPKAAIAYAGTWLVGMGLEKVNRTGVQMTRVEKRATYKAGLGHGKEFAREAAPIVVRKI